MCKAQVIKPNLRYFGQFPEVEVINGDEQIWDKTFLICVDYFNVYLVISDNEQDALDELADYFEAKEYTGYFLNESDIDLENEDIVCAGNYGRALAIDQLIIEQI